MKKLLSLVLVLVMVLGLTVPAFAENVELEFSSQGTLNDYIKNYGYFQLKGKSVDESIEYRIGVRSNKLTGNFTAANLTPGSDYFQLSNPPYTSFNTTDKSLADFTGVADESGNIVYSGTITEHAVSGDVGTFLFTITIPAITFGITNGTPQESVKDNNGYLTIDKESSVANQIITVTPVPAEGYQVKTLTYKSATDEEATVIVKDAASGNYQFTMPVEAVTVTAEFEKATAKSGNTTITATVAAPKLEYEIIIPDAVTMNEAGVKEIGAAKINMEEGKLKNATANTVISYTASGTNFTLKECEATMPANYYSEYTKNGEQLVSYTDLDITKSFEVYKNSALVNPLTTLYVRVKQEDWDAAAKNNPGTYTATVTYNFSAEEKEPVVTIANLLATVEGGFPGIFTGTKWTNGNPSYTMYKLDEDGIEYFSIFNTLFAPTATELTKTSAKEYTYVNGGVTLTFNLNDSGVLENIVLSGAYEGNGTYAAPVTYGTILASVANFPVSTTYMATSLENPWQTGNGQIAYIYENMLCFAENKNTNPAEIMYLTNCPGMKSGDNYVWVDFENTITFNMSGETLESITVNYTTGNKTVLNGTYTCPAD